MRTRWNVKKMRERKNKSNGWPNITKHEREEEQIQLMAKITKYEKERESIQLMAKIEGELTTNPDDNRHLPNTRREKDRIQPMGNIFQIRESERTNPSYPQNSPHTRKGKNQCDRERGGRESNRWPKICQLRE